MTASASPLEMHSRDQLHRLVVRLAAICTWVVAFGLAVMALADGDVRVLVQSAVAAVAGLIFTVQLLSGRTNAIATLALGAIVLGISMPLMSHPSAYFGGAMGVVVIAVVATLFVEARILPVLVIMSVAVLLAPFLWIRDFTTAFMAGLTMAAAYAIGAAGLVTIRRQTTLADDQFRRLFERAPVGLIVQDWSEALTYLDSLGVSSAERLGAMLAEDSDLLTRIVTRVRTMRANQVALRIFNATEETMLGPLSPLRVAECNRSVWIDQVVGIWSGNPIDTAEYETVDYQGNPGLSVEIRTISAGGQHPDHVLIALTDITGSRKRSRDLADLVREKDEFIATVSHELRTPLTAVVGLANEVLAAEDLGAGERRELLELVVAQANEISHIVEDLLVGARADIGTITVTSDTVDLLQETEAVASGLGTLLETTWESASRRARGDAVRIRQIIRNLIVNAQRYGGTRRRVVLASAGNMVTLEMRDNGEPIPVDERERIFEPYTRAHDRPGVTASVGLGLAVSRRLARRMNGELEYTHDGWEGIFRLSLPAAEPEPVKGAGWKPWATSRTTATR